MSLLIAYCDRYLGYEHHDSVVHPEVGVLGVGDLVLPPVEQVGHGLHPLVQRQAEAVHGSKAEYPPPPASWPLLQDGLETRHRQFGHTLAALWIMPG